MRRLIGLLFLLLSLAGCNPEVDVYAPEKELYAVYGVLNPKAPQQYVTVTKVFQTDGDAYLYAAQNDLTARGLVVTLQSDSIQLTSDLIEIPDTLQTLFPRTTGVYRILTTGGDALQPGRRYDLRITKPDDPDFSITSWTVIPTQPILTSPGPPYYSEQQRTYTFPSIDFMDDLSVTFWTGSGKGFELRLYVKYWDGQVEKTAQWGPTPVFMTPKGCNANVGQGEMCYEIGETSVSNALYSIFAAYLPDTVELLDTVRVASTLDSLSQKTWMEVTGVDSFLTLYLYSSNPIGFGVNLLLDKPDYTNISGENTGIFGSINTSRRYIFLGDCVRWLSGLHVVRPHGCGN
jgi:hypothetical protein